MMTEVRKRNDYYQLKRSKTLTSSMDSSTERRGSFTPRSELSDSLRRANNQESSRLQLRVQGFDKARDLVVSEISQQERALAASSARGRRSSSPGPALRALIHQQLSADKQKWKQKFKSFMTTDVTGKTSPTDEMNVTGRKLYASSEHLGAARYYDDDTGKSRSSSREEVGPDPGDNNTQSTANRGRKLAREQVWRNLSTPKHPKTSIKQLREKIEAEIKAESTSKSNTLQRIQTLPLIGPESRGLIASGEKGDRNRTNKSMYLTVPAEIHTSRSAESLAETGQQLDIEAIHPVDFDVNGRFHASPGTRRRMPHLQRQRSQSLVVSSSGNTAQNGTGNNIDLRLLLPPEVEENRTRAGSEPCKELSLVLPEVKIETLD